MKILCVFGRSAYGNLARGESYEAVNFLPAFKRLGHDVSLFDSFTRQEDVDFAGLNLRFLQCLGDYRPDLIFFVLMSYEIWTETLDLVRADSPAITVNWGTDDSWKFNQVSRFLIPHLDFHVTTDRHALYAAKRAGLGNVVSSQWAASQTQLSEPVPDSECVYDVSFVGKFYGARRAWIDGLRARGVNVTTFGHGSDVGVVAASAVPEIYRKSRISLNFSESGRHLIGVQWKRSKQIKARVFEVTGAGGVLLSQDAGGLSEYFQPGQEIETFGGLDELATKTKFFLANPAARDRMAWAGYRRTSSEHTYDRRFRRLLEHCRTNIAPERVQRPWQIDAKRLQNIAERHRDTKAIRPLRAATETFARALVGRERSANAARRIVFEASWRLAGKRTFSAAGLPGRLFFRES